MKQKCDYCGTRNDNERDNCKSCGAPLADMPQDDPSKYIGSYDNPARPGLYGSTASVIFNGTALYHTDTMNDITRYIQW